MHKSNHRIPLISVAALLLMAVILRLINRGADSSIDYAYGMLGTIGVLFVGNLVALLVLNRFRQDFMLAMLLVLLIGLGICAGGTTSYGV